MKSKNPVRDALGITQQALADLLNVTRVQWALYECGQRYLPPHASRLLAALTLDIHSGKFDSARREFQKEQRLMQYERLERMLTEMNYKKAVLTKKMVALRKKQQENEKLFRTAQLLAGYRYDESIKPEWPLVSPKMPCKKERQRFENKLLELDLELESLELKKLIVESRIRKIAKTLDFTDASTKDNNVS